MLELVKRKTPKPIKNILRKMYHLIKSILKPMPSHLSNFNYNKKLWSIYAKGWSKKKARIENTDIGDEERESYLKYLGDEWGRIADVEKIIAEYIYPFITKSSVVAEIGVGGARIASRVVDRTEKFYCFDISSEMLKKAKAALSDYSYVNYVLLNQPKFPDKFAGKFDFVYSFDVFVHLDLHTMWRYFNEIRIILKEGGKAFIHTTNLKAPDGWRRFSSQKAYTIEGHYFVSPEIIDILAQHSNLRIVKTSDIDPTNFYLNRDYLVVLEKE